MATANQELLDALIRHQIGLLRLSSSVRNRLIKLLNDSEADLQYEIERRLAAIVSAAGVDITSPNVLRRLKALEKIVAEIRSAAFEKATALWKNEFTQLTVDEANFMSNATKTVSPVILELATPDISALRALVTTNAFEGRTLSAWAADLKRTDINRINDQIRIGLVQGNTTREITRRVFGLNTLQGTDGVTELTRNNASSITRTAVNFYANAAKELFYLANQELFSNELFVATLDGRTTPLCRSLDGKIYPVGEGPRPPLHWGCRSLRVALLTAEAVGTRPFNPTTEKMLVSEFAKANKLGNITDRDALPYGLKGLFDKFAQGRARELIGTVPASVSYSEWLGRQSNAFQDSVLGKTKAVLYRKGGLTLDKFVDNKGSEYTLKQLARLDREAFVHAGLNPADY